MITTQNDWHPADIIAALRKRGTTLAALKHWIMLTMLVQLPEKRQPMTFLSFLTQR